LAGGGELLLAYQGSRFPRTCRLQSGRQRPGVLMPLQPASAIGTDLGAHGDQSSLIGFTGAFARERAAAASYIGLYRFVYIDYSDLYKQSCSVFFSKSNQAGKHKKHRRRNTKSAKLSIDFFALFVFLLLCFLCSQ
jgi:hypothetical protein